MIEPTTDQLTQFQAYHLRWLENYTSRQYKSFHGVNPLQCLNYELIQVFNHLMLEWLLRETNHTDVIEDMGEFDNG